MSVRPFRFFAFGLLVALPFLGLGQLGNAPAVSAGGGGKAATNAVQLGTDGPMVAPGMKAVKPDFRSFLEPRVRRTTELERLAEHADKAHPDYGVLPWNAPCADCVELPSRRTATGRYFVASGSKGHRFFVQEASGPMHFRDREGRWRTRDPHLYPAGALDPLFGGGSDTDRFLALSQPLPTGLDLQRGQAAMRLADGFVFRFSGAASAFGEEHALALATGEPIGPIRHPLGSPDFSRVDVGKDGMRAWHAWPGIDMVQLFREGEIETDFVLREAAAVPEGVRVVFQDRWAVPESYSVDVDPSTGRWTDVAGWRCWTGDLVLERSVKGASTDAGGTPELLRLKRPLLYDAAGNSNLHDGPKGPALIGYRFRREGVGPGSAMIVETVVDAEWLRSPERAYPVVVDPILYGLATYTGGDIGFNYDAACFDLTDYCSANLSVTVPGQTTLTGAWFDAQYFSVLMGCFIGMSDCLMREAAFQIVGPCDTSPGVGTFWSCLPPEGDSSGTCYGDSLDLFNTVSCLPPQCPDYVLDFEMRTFHCSCNGPNCGVACHFMPDNTWRITIEGRTVEEDPIQSFDQPDFTICPGDSITLEPSAQWGVPPYTYQWTPGGVFADPYTVGPASTTTYTSVVFDACMNTDTVSQEVTVLPAPSLAPGPFRDCEPDVVLDAGSGFVSYFWPHSGETTQTVTVSTPGNYVVEVTDANGCTGTSDSMLAEIIPPPIVDAMPDSVVVDEGALVQLDVTALDPGPVSFTWTPASSLTCANCPSPFAFPVNNTTYLVYGSLYGCEGPPDSIRVFVEQVELVLPNAFTPNGDGLNDNFGITNPARYPSFALRVYNRWGQEVFATGDPSTRWDGTFQGVNQEAGAYIWMIVYTKGREGGEEVQRAGTVTLIR